MAAKRKLELDRALESAAVAYSVLDSKFWGVVGYALDAEQMPTEAAQLVVKARHEVEKATRGGPCSPRLIAQRFRIWRHAGQITLEEAGIAMDWLRDAEAAVERGTDKQGVQTALVEVLKFHLNSAAVDMAMSLHSKRRTDMSAALKLFEKAAKLGVYQAPQRLSSQDEKLLERISTGKQDRLPTGISALDDALDGGLGRGELGFCIGGTGDGKSMFLSQVAASALYARRNVVIITMELSKERWNARLLAAMADVPARSILDADLTPEQRARLLEAKAYADFEIVQMAAGGTTAEDVWALFDALNEERKAEGKAALEVLVVDYADRFAIPTGMTPYEGMLHQYEALRLGAAERKMWAWTASAAKATNAAPGGTKRKKKRADGEDDIAVRGVESGADSQNKARVADVVVTLNASENKKRTKVALVKNRNGEVGFVSAIMETDYAFGRLTMADWAGGVQEAAKETGIGGFTTDLSIWD